MRWNLSGLAALLITASLTGCSDAPPANPAPGAGPSAGYEPLPQFQPATGYPNPGSSPAPGYPAPAPAAQSRPSGPFRRFEPAVIVDASGFSQPMAAASLFIPHGWQARGGVVWGQEHLCTNGYNFDWVASSPDGLASVAIVPQAAWEANSTGSAANRPGCPLLNIGTVRAYLEAVVGQRVPGARILDYRDRPDVLREINARDQRTPMPLGETRTWSEAGEVFFGFQNQGREMRGSLAAAVQFQLMVTDMSSIYQTDPTLPMLPGGTLQSRMEALSAFANPGWAAVAPDGAFDFELFEALRRSIRPAPSWNSAIAGHNTAIGQAALRESIKRGRIINETNDYIARLRQETWTAQQESSDRRAREFGEAIRGVETYVDPNAPGGTSEHSYQYDNVWRLNDGSYILSDDPNFDPWRDLQLTGERLEVLR